MRHANLSEGLRAACGAGTMLLLGQLLHNPLFSWAAIGAFLTCLADSAGSNRARLASMGGFALVSTLAGMFAATLSGDGHIAGLLAIMSCAGIAGFSRLYGAATGLVLMLAAGVSAILADFPVVLWPLQQSHVLIYFAGCAWATLLGLTVWRIHPFAPARAALARVYEALAELAATEREEQAATTRHHVLQDINSAHNALTRIDTGRANSRQLYEDLSIKLVRADALLSCITVLGDLRPHNYQDAAIRRRIGRVLHSMALLLQQIALDIASDSASSEAEQANTVLRLHQLLGRMPTQARQRLALPDLVMDNTARQALVAHWTFAADAPATPAGLPQRWRELCLHTVALLGRGYAHLRADSEEMQHGLRCAVAAGSTYLLVHLLALPFGYWATMATMLVMQPSIADSWTRSMERAIGSIVGGVLAVLLCLFIHSPLLMALLVFPLSALAMGLRPVSYGLYSTFLTPVFVLVADVASNPQQQLSNALLRAGNNLLGALVAIAACYLLWPRRRKINLHHHLTLMILSNLDYLCAALDAKAAQPTQPLQAQRRSTCVVNNATGTLLQRLAREQKIDHRQMHNARVSVALSRRLATTASQIWLHHDDVSHAADDIALRCWLEPVRALFDRTLMTRASYSLLLQQRPPMHDSARADAVDTLCLLIVSMYPELSSTAVSIPR